MTSRSRSLLALVLLAPVPTLGIAAALIWWPGPVGRTVFTAAKIWILAFPVVWHLLVDKGQLGWSRPKQGGLGSGVLIGLGMAAAIAITGWMVVITQFDPAALKSEAADMGLTSPMTYLLGALYWTFVNSLIEEYVFRWFIQSHCQALMPKWTAIAASAAIFTTHHVVAVSTYLDPGLTALASAGVFIAGATWSWMVTRYQSIWPGWVAHVIADVAVFTAGWYLLFG